MIPDLRERYNSEFTEEKYLLMLERLESRVESRIEFRACETPVFLPGDLLREMLQASLEIVSQLNTPEYKNASTRSIPAEFNTPNEGDHPDFIQVDYAIVLDEEGRPAPKLIELQGCASLYAFQYVLPHEYKRLYSLEGLDYLLNDLSDEGYLDLLRKMLLNGHPAEQVILMEIDPLNQKTLPDFKMTTKIFGIPMVNVSDVIKRGRKLYYRVGEKEIEIKRIYNRVIIDEFVRKEIKAAFDFRDELDVEWAGHPNWYFRYSKFSLPYLNHKAVPRAWFLDQLKEYPADIENFVLKPLFSFAGAGVKVHITREDLDAVPTDERADYLLQEKVVYAPVIKTTEGYSKVEVRVMYVWPQSDPAPTPVTTLTRLSKGEMMGVDFNKNMTWVGSSCGFFKKV